MSVRAVARVWEASTAKGGELLVLLAIADYAEDDGRNAWPTVLKLAAKSRMSERGVRTILRRLESLEELEVEKNVAGFRARDGHRPRFLMHVLCCAHPAKIAGPTGKDCRSDPEQIAGSTSKDCRVNNQTPAKIAGSEPAKIAGESNSATGRITYHEPAESRTRIRKIRQDPLVRTSTGAVRRSTPHPVEIANPSSRAATPGTFGLYCVIAKEARQRSNDEDHSDQIGNIAEWFKTFCAQRSIQYDSAIVTKAIEAVMQADERAAVGLLRKVGAT